MLGILIILSGRSIFDLREPKDVSAGIDIIIGILLIVVGIFEIKGKRNAMQKKFEPQDVSGSMSPNLYKIAALGGLLCITNTSSLVFYLAAAKRTAETNLSIYEKIAAILFVSIFFLLPIIIPLLLTLLTPTSSKKSLEAINEVLRKYGSYLVVVVALSFGVFLIAMGILELTGINS